MRTEDDNGAALITVIIWSTVLIVLTGLIAQVVTNQIRPSDRTEKSYQALSAAEAGIEKYRTQLINASAQLTGSTSAWDLVPPPADWEEIDLGDDGKAEFIYGVDTSQAALTGEITVTATGRAGRGDNEITRTVEAVIVKRSSIDYAWFTDSEALHPDYPGLYCDDDVPKNKMGQECPRGLLHQSNATLLCDTHYSGDSGASEPGRYWWQDGPGLLSDYDDPQPPVGTSELVTLPGIDLYHRNSSLCVTEPIQSPSTSQLQAIRGNMHTNDVWYIDRCVPDIDPLAPESVTSGPSIGAGCSGVDDRVFYGQITSSCADAAPGTLGCPADHRWIDQSGDTAPAYADGTYPTDFENASLQGSTRLWNPGYDSVLELPNTLDKLRYEADANGCVYSGPTRIQFAGDEVFVTSPDTDSASVPAYCLGTAAQVDPSFTTSLQPHTTHRLSYSAMVASGFNGVFFVQDATALPPHATSGVLPTCKPKEVNSSKVVPYVIPDVANTTWPWAGMSGAPTRDVFWESSGGTTIDGFPSQTSEPDWDNWNINPSIECSRGHLYVDGRYDGNITLATDGDIVITGHLHESGARTSAVIGGTPVTYPGKNVYTSVFEDPDYGKPEGTGLLGLAPGGYAYLYTYQRLVSNIMNYRFDNVILNFAMLSPTGCLTVADPDITSNAYGEVRIWGSVGQKNRCNILDRAGTSGFSALTINYDDRFRSQGVPAFFRELSEEPWQIRQLSETTVRRDAQARTSLLPVEITMAQAQSGPIAVLELAGAPEGTSLDFARIKSGPGTIESNGDSVTFSPGSTATTYAEFIVYLPDGTRVGQDLTIVP